MRNEKNVYTSKDFIICEISDTNGGNRTALQFYFPAQGNRGFYSFGMDIRNDDTVDLRGYQGLEFDVTGSEAAVIKVEVVFGEDTAIYNETNIGRGRGIAVWTGYVSAKDSAHVIVNFKDFDDQKTRCGAWRFVKGFRVYSDKEVGIDKFKLSKGIPFYVKSDIYSKSAREGETITYFLEVGNCTEEKQWITLNRKKYGWETMNVIMQDTILLEPWQKKIIPVKVVMNGYVAPGGYESQMITAIPNGNSALSKECVLISQKYLEHPYILATEQVYQDTFRKISEQAWAKETFENYLILADDFIVPEIDSGKPYLFLTEISHVAQKTAIAWKLSKKQEYLEKVVLFLRRLTDDGNGYLTNLCACHQELVHEGEFFQSAAIAYDIVCSSGMLTKEDHGRITAVFRRFMELIDFALSDGNISNWALCELTGALFCSLALQDRERAERFLFGIGGMKEQIGVGVLDDGWWYEVSIGYNQLAAGLFSKMHIAMKPWGLNLKDMWFPPAYTKEINKKNGSIDGLVIEAWGPRTKNYRNLEMQWDSMIPFSDERGVIFGLSDSAESKLSGIAIVDPRYDVAYHLFRKNSYARAVKLSNDGRDLLYGEAVLPESVEQEIPSCYADNSGIVWLRSQKSGRSLREQIAVSVKYGCHGGAHGHYDRTAMNSLMRYGKSMYNPENVWYSYKTFLYKFYVQNSITHNMVTVDLKQQDPCEAKRLLFYSGTHIQACVVENTARWCNPPYGGWNVYGEKSYTERAWKEGRYVKACEEEPTYTKHSGFTEPVLQRRATVVTDDYVINFDYAKGDKEHDFHCIYHIKGFKGIEGAKLTGTGEILDDSPLSSGQFITDVAYYDYEKGARASFQSVFKKMKEEEKALNPDRTFYNEEGVLKVDVYSAFPQSSDIICAHVPENYHVAKQMTYQIEGDSEVLAEGRLGTWVLGRDEILTDLTMKRNLSLKIHVNPVIGEYWNDTLPLKTIFWGDPYFVMENGRIYYLSEFMEDSSIVSTKNLDYGCGIGKDYYEGPVKLQAKQYVRAIPAEPADSKEDSMICISLEQIINKTGQKPKQFGTAVGGDFPLGDETQNRTFYAVRQKASKARFITVLEPYEENRMIRAVNAVTEDEINIRLADGRIHNIKLKGFEEDKGITISFSEFKDGECLVREEAQEG
ncbi:MAG: hypothetical protein WCD89_14160 [Anaerocolumna sp.]